MNVLLITQEDFLAGSTFSVSYLAGALAARGNKEGFGVARIDHYSARGNFFTNHYSLQVRSAVNPVITTVG
jgi:hypothetical protein